MAAANLFKLTWQKLPVTNCEFWHSKLPAGIVLTNMGLLDFQNDRCRSEFCFDVRGPSSLDQSICRCWLPMTAAGRKATDVGTAFRTTISGHFQGLKRGNPHACSRGDVGLEISLGGGDPAVHSWGHHHRLNSTFWPSVWCDEVPTLEQAWSLEPCALLLVIERCLVIERDAKHREKSSPGGWLQRKYTCPRLWVMVIKPVVSVAFRDEPTLFRG